jgi:hypothetical protein
MRTNPAHMNLLYLHGPPASGKRTIAEAVQTVVGGRWFPNHVAIDYAKTVLDFDGPGFWDLVHSVRLAALDAAGRHGQPLVLHTSCYSHPEDLPLVEGFERIVQNHGGELLPVFVTCRRETLDARVGLPDRMELRKLTSRERLADFLAAWNLTAVPRPNCLTIDSDLFSPEQAAEEIVRRFRLSAGDVTQERGDRSL